MEIHDCFNHSEIAEDTLIVYLYKFIAEIDGYSCRYSFCGDGSTKMAPETRYLFSSC